MKQTTFASLAWNGKGKITRRERFLAEMDAVIPWARLAALIEPHYPNTGRGRPPVGLERMLRLHFLQHWYNLSDPGLEEELLESESMRRFVGIDLGQERVPDETTVCKFRHLLERNGLGAKIFERVGQHLQARGFRLSAGHRRADGSIGAPALDGGRRRRTRADGAVRDRVEAPDPPARPGDVRGDRAGGGAGAGSGCGAGFRQDNRCVGGWDTCCVGPLPVNPTAALWWPLSRAWSPASP